MTDLCALSMKDEIALIVSAKLSHLPIFEQAVESARWSYRPGSLMPDIALPTRED